MSIKDKHIQQILEAQLFSTKHTKGLDNFQGYQKLTDFGLKWLTHRVISDRVHRLLVTLSYFGRIDSCNFLV